MKMRHLRPVKKRIPDGQPVEKNKFTGHSAAVITLSITLLWQMYYNKLNIYLTYQMHCTKNHNGSSKTLICVVYLLKICGKYKNDIHRNTEIYLRTMPKNY